MSQGPTSKIELRISCQNLPNLDTFSKTDCKVFVYLLDRSSKSDPQSLRPNGVLLGNTETIKNNLNPTFSTPILVDYFFEVEQILHFSLVDIDDKFAQLSDQDFIGSVRTNLSNILGKSGQKLTLPILKNKKQVGNATLTVSAEEVADSKREFAFSVSATVPKKNLVSRPDPFFKIFRAKEDGSEVAVFTSSTVSKSTEASWQTTKVRLQSLCNSDVDRSLAFRFYDWESNGSHIYIGEFSASVNEMVQRGSICEFPLVKIASAKRDKVGTVRLSCSLYENASFLDYITHGCQLNLTVGIDFTLSNIEPHNPKSLHYRDPTGLLNSYQKAILSVGSILQDYDSDKMFPVYGFGAKLPNGSVSHCWPINGNVDKPECAGVEGILSAYQMALDNISLYGPTNFTPLIHKCCERISSEMSQRRPGMPWNYHTLLIITDGEITDMDSTVRSLNRASSLPLSVVIIGVGNECDFECMAQLDGDSESLKSDGGRKGERDIVQFVPMRKFNNLPPETVQAELAKEVLAEIPNQLISWFYKNNINPSDLKNK